MQVITSVAELQHRIDECNRVGIEQSDDAMRRLFTGFRMDLSEGLPPDPFSPEYAAFQDSIYQTVAGKPYALGNEHTPLDPTADERRLFPYTTRSTSTAGHHLLAIGFMLTQLGLPTGSRIVEFGPGWGNTTMELARLGMDVTAVDIEPGFCEIIRRRAAHAGLDITVVEGDFFWAEGVTEPFDAAIFFECFHHCSDHMRLLRALHRTVKPGGHVFLGSEPIFPTYPVPWGVRMDGEALWAMRNFGWLELGYDEAYFREALARTGWHGTRHPCQDVYWASAWTLRPTEPGPLLPPGTFPPVRGKAATWYGLPSPAEDVPPHVPEPPPVPAGKTEAELLRRELQAVYRSTSWRLTRPVRTLGRMARRLVRPGNESG